MREKTTRQYSFTIVLEPQAEGGYSVVVPALPEVTTEGETEAEALAMAREAIELALEYRRDHDLAIPGDAVPEIHKVEVALAV